jgi:7,8-dihydro-6-hydroxymethylpterin-pyrophosphokinase
MDERRFVLEPLAELQPGVRHPMTNESITGLQGAVPGQEARPLPGDDQ